MLKFDLCIIPAAGKGTRMGDLCKDKAKCMLAVKDKPILKHILDFWEPYCANVITVIQEKHSIDVGQLWSYTKTVVQPKPLGINDAILCALRQVRVPEQFLVVLGDCLMAGKFDWSHYYVGAHGIGVMDGDSNFARSYAVEIRGEIRVDRLIEKPRLGMGVYLLNWKCLAALENNVNITETVDELTRTQAVVPIPFTGRYLNVTEPGDLTRW